MYDLVEVRSSLEKPEDLSKKVNLNYFEHFFMTLTKTALNTSLRYAIQKDR